jgi:hypothetical protein
MKLKLQKSQSFKFLFCEGILFLTLAHDKYIWNTVVLYLSEADVFSILSIYLSDNSSYWIFSDTILPQML